MRKLLTVLVISLFIILFCKYETYSADYTSIEMTQAEFTEVAKVVSGESQSDKYEAQLAVVEIIFNRCLDSRFPNTPYDVVSQKGEFEVWKIRDAKWVEPKYGSKVLMHVLQNGCGTILPDSSYVIFSTKKQSYGYDYIKIGKTYFGKLS